MLTYPIVILPGWRLNTRRYQQTADHLSALGYQVFIVDFPGFDITSNLKQVLNLSDYVRYLSKFLKHNQIGKAVFVCHSFGGRVALKYISQEPKKAAGLIISGTPGYLPIKNIKLKIFFWGAKVGGKIFSFPIMRFVKNSVRKIYYRIIGARDYYHTEGNMRETFKNIIKESLVDYMKKIRVPVLLLWGSKDKTVPVKVAKKMQQTIRSAKLEVIPDADHMFICNNMEKAVDPINKFIKELI